MWLPYLIIIVLFLVLASVLMVYRVRRNRDAKKNMSLNSTLQQLINQDQYEYFLIDVRSEAEYKKGHIPTALNVPYGKLGSYLPTDNLFTNIVVYGRSPLQSSRAANIMSDAGYFNVTSFGPVFKWRGPVSRKDKENDEQKTS